MRCCIAACAAAGSDPLRRDCWCCCCRCWLQTGGCCCPAHAAVSRKQLAQQHGLHLAHTILPVPLLFLAASREQMAYNIDCTKATIPEALEVLADAVLNPKFQSWEVAEQVRADGHQAAVPTPPPSIYSRRPRWQRNQGEGIQLVLHARGLSGRPLISRPFPTLAGSSARWRRT